MATASDIINRSLRMLSVIGSGKSATASEASDALNILNAMIDSWSIDRLTVYQILEETFTWAASSTSRTIGPTGDFVTVRPNSVEGGFSRINNVDYLFKMIDKRDYDSIAVKTTSSTYPNVIFYDPTATNGTLYAYPVPNASLSVHLKSWKQLQSFTTLTDSLTLPPGYQRAIEYNLAVELSTEYPDLPLSDLVRQKATESLSAIKTINSPTLLSATGLGKGRRYNIYADAH
jgi:hypothetical protein